MRCATHLQSLGQVFEAQDADDEGERVDAAIDTANGRPMLWSPALIRVPRINQKATPSRHFTKINVKCGQVEHLDLWFYMKFTIQQICELRGFHWGGFPTFEYFPCSPWNFGKIHTEFRICDPKGSFVHQFFFADMIRNLTTWLHIFAHGVGSKRTTIYHPPFN